MENLQNLEEKNATQIMISSPIHKKIWGFRKMIIGGILILTTGASCWLWSKLSLRQMNFLRLCLTSSNMPIRALRLVGSILNMTCESTSPCTWCLYLGSALKCAVILSSIWRQLNSNIAVTCTSEKLQNRKKSKNDCFLAIFGLILAMFLTSQPYDFDAIAQCRRTVQNFIKIVWTVSENYFNCVEIILREERDGSQ